MKRFVLTACAGLFTAVMATVMATVMAAPSLAADLSRPVYKAPAYIAPIFTWTGFYAGINGGYGWGRSNWTNALGSTGDFTVKGWLVGGTLGYNLQTGVWVFGFEGDFDYSNIRGTETTFCAAPGCTTRNTWLGTARGRVGYSFDRWLPFVTGGAAFGNIKMTTPAGMSESKTRAGWTLGGGVEYAFLGAWSAKLEYLYVDLGKTTCGTGTCGLETDVKFRTNIVRLGFNYRF